MRSDPRFVIASGAKQSMARPLHFQPAVYMMANHKSDTIYVGVTSDLPKRAWQHREGQVDGFTKRYGCKRLVWLEQHSTMEAAIAGRSNLKAAHEPRKSR